MKNPIAKVINSLVHAEEMKPYFKFTITSWDEWHNAKKDKGVVIYDGYDIKEASVVLRKTKDDYTCPSAKVTILKEWDEIQKARKTQAIVFKPYDDDEDDNWLPF